MKDSVGTAAAIAWFALLLALLSCSNPSEVDVRIKVPVGEILELPADFSVPVAIIEMVPDKVSLTNCYYELFDKGGETSGPQYFAGWHRSSSPLATLTVENTTSAAKTGSRVRRQQLDSGEGSAGAFLYLLFGNDDSTRPEAGEGFTSVFGVGIPDPEGKYCFLYVPEDRRTYEDRRTVIGYLYVTEQTNVPVLPRNLQEMTALMGPQDWLLELTYRVGWAE